MNQNNKKPSERAMRAAKQCENEGWFDDYKKHQVNLGIVALTIDKEMGVEELLKLLGRAQNWLYAFAADLRAAKEVNSLRAVNGVINDIEKALREAGE